MKNRTLLGPRAYHNSLTLSEKKILIFGGNHITGYETYFERGCENQQEVQVPVLPIELIELKEGQVENVQEVGQLSIPQGHLLPQWLKVDEKTVLLYSSSGMEALDLKTLNTTPIEFFAPDYEPIGTWFLLSNGEIMGKTSQRYDPYESKPSYLVTYNLKRKEWKKIQEVPLCEESYAYSTSIGEKSYFFKKDGSIDEFDAENGMLNRVHESPTPFGILEAHSSQERVFMIGNRYEKEDKDRGYPKEQILNMFDFQTKTYGEKELEAITASEKHSWYFFKNSRDAIEVSHTQRNPNALWVGLETGKQEKLHLKLPRFYRACSLSFIEIKDQLLLVFSGGLKWNKAKEQYEDVADIQVASHTK